VDSFSGAPSSDTDSTSDGSNQSSSMEENIDTVNITRDRDSESDIDMSDDVISALHWENGMQLGQLHYKMCPSSTAL
jgi:hypothetical protein